eukprot:CAMPEP_0204076636 /NCGR_PEP_ID=MMETSP0360-20130528/168176_1 /ASSEMBLY_ACC=CAM_ASM_000342 /TAXON_ID=268821 /ORGANISM="Scrippsiella Hangoei, Strain SHTV-5" /LENGTH=103 /DNA_ID=CAMNT_0051025193 /DNA_START=227 /DNA_END=538 /DNA_ORIENTATION=+
MRELAVFAMRALAFAREVPAWNGFAEVCRRTTCHTVDRPQLLLAVRELALVSNCARPCFGEVPAQHRLVEIHLCIVASGCSFRTPRLDHAMHKPSLALFEDES